MTGLYKKKYCVGISLSRGNWRSGNNQSFIVHFDTSFSHSELSDGGTNFTSIPSIGDLLSFSPSLQIE